jgi:hypothetical protein
MSQENMEREVFEAWAVTKFLNKQTPYTLTDIFNAWQARAALAELAAHSEDARQMACKSCGGNNADVPCAYPEGVQPHCLRAAPAPSASPASTPTLDECLDAFEALESIVASDGERVTITFAQLRAMTARIRELERELSIAKGNNAARMDGLADAIAKLERAQPAAVAAVPDEWRGLRQAAKNFYNATTGQPALRMSSSSKHIRDEAESAGQSLRSALLITSDAAAEAPNAEGKA